MQSYFSEQAILAMREEIAAVNGNEVFFLGRTDDRQVVVSVEPLARGNRDAVAAIMIAASCGDVVIHNHPSGVLTPSRPDLEIASVLGNQGVGFYIIDNGVANCYRAVSPFVRKQAELLALDEIQGKFAPGGVLAVNLADYEYRPEQTRMAFAVAEAFNVDRVAVIEAGTGTGKSLAYLLPAALWATRNKERVVISTNTINLQEQLTRKDIPFLQQHANLPFRAVLVKGRSNYLCRRKLAGIGEEPSLFKDEAADLQAILAWSETTASGCRDDLSFIPRDEVWEEVCCEADQCGRVKCPSYGKCFFYTSRREAAGADLLVVNHALLMADIALRQETGYGASAILPPFERLIVDEGHHLEDVATGHLSSQVTRQGLLKLLGKLQHPRKAQRGFLPLLSSMLSREVPEAWDELYLELSSLLEGGLIQGLPVIQETVNRELDGIGMALLRYLRLSESKGGERKLRITPTVYDSGFWQEVTGRVDDLGRALADYGEALGRLLKECGRLPDRVLDKMAGTLIDLKGVKGRLESAAEGLLFFRGRDEGFCRWFEVKKGPKGLVVRLCSSPLEVAQSLRSALFDKFRTVVVTSATLAVGERFDYLAKRTGISLLPRVRLTELLLASPFDYQHQAFVGIPADLPEPTAPGFESGVARCLRQALAISQGRAFVLFTSYDLLIRLFNQLAPHLEHMGLAPMRQGETNRHLLLSRFKKTPGAVLFGTDSFWEGVDVQGRALELVVITRLPFRVPTEPILEARAEHISAQGGDPFMEYTVPQAVIKFKQGFGRLIRSKEDRGGVLILDSRVLSRPYGRMFLSSLPDAQLLKGEEAAVLAGLKAFFGSGETPTDGPSSPAWQQS